MLENALIVAGGYLIGSIPVGVVVVRVFRGEDIRKQGSGNVGATNVWRTYGRWLGVPVVLLDVAKGFVPALVGLQVGGEWVGRPRGRGRDARPRPPDLARVREGRQDGRDGAAAWRSRSPRSPPASASSSGSPIFILFRYASLASCVAGRRGRMLATRGRSTSGSRAAARWWRPVAA